MTTNVIREVADPCVPPCGYVHREIVRDAIHGYPIENVERLDPKYEAELAAWLVNVQTGHTHDGYGWRGCAVCRRVEAERVSRRFPETSFRAVTEHDGTRFLGGRAYEGDTQ